MSLRSACYDPAFITPELMEGYLAPTRIRGHLRALGSLMVDRRLDAPLDVTSDHPADAYHLGNRGPLDAVRSWGTIAGADPGASLVLVEKAGHLVLEEQPEECSRAIIGFSEGNRRGQARRPERKLDRRAA